MEMNHYGETIKFFGSLAEGSDGSRPFMVKEGVFDDVGAVADNHAGGYYFTRYVVNDNALLCAVFSFIGKTAHSAANPWNGRNALNGVELMNVATNYFHEHLFTTHRIHSVITEGGETSYVVPEKASAYYYIRDTDDRIENTFLRVVDCAKGAALASGTILDTILIVKRIFQYFK
jgi:aminobenzoyl-glutamate utilization protein B